MSMGKVWLSKGWMYCLPHCQSYSICWRHLIKVKCPCDLLNSKFSKDVPWKVVQDGGHFELKLILHT